MPASSRPIANLPGLAPTRDSDPAETSDWLDSLELMFRHSGPERAEFILSALEHKARELGVYSDVLPFSPYRNTIPLEKQSRFPGDIAMETRITAIMRWNALAMVVRANKAYGELGGHVASYASVAEIFEVGFNHFFRGGRRWRRRRSAVFPAALGAGRLRSRLPRGPARASNSSIAIAGRSAGPASAPIPIPG